jgi:hypothetical protein
LPVQPLGLCSAYPVGNYFWAIADIVSSHAPATEANRNMIGADELSSMKKGAYLINVARGSLVDENALALALHEGRIAGAAFDVFPEEPPSAADPLLKVEEDKLLPVGTYRRRIYEKRRPNHDHGNRKHRARARWTRCALRHLSASPYRGSCAHRFPDLSLPDRWSGVRAG